MDKGGRLTPNANNTVGVQGGGKEEASEQSSDEDSLISSDEEPSWISWFCSLRGNEFFVEVDDEYIQDDFNLTGLNTLVPNYEVALDLLQEVDPEEPLTEDQQAEVDKAAELLYGLIHARYILTTRGLQAMMEKYTTADFGRCPRVFCQGQQVVPVGQSDLPHTNTVKLFCPKCLDLYYPKFNRHCSIDGAFFGTSFPHILLATYPELLPPRPTQSYVPRIYGFKIHKSSTILNYNLLHASSNANNNANANTNTNNGANNAGTNTNPNTNNTNSNSTVVVPSNPSPIPPNIIPKDKDKAITSSGGSIRKKSGDSYVL